jgi:hypothetical protein
LDYFNTVLVAPIIYIIKGIVSVNTQFSSTPPPDLFMATVFILQVPSYPQSSSTLWNYSKCGVYTVESEAGC